MTWLVREKKGSNTSMCDVADEVPLLSYSLSDVGQDIPHPEPDTNSYSSFFL